MAGQLWSAGSGFMATPTLSEELRNSVQPLSRFTQFCDVEIAIGKNAGETYTWNVYGDTAVAGSKTGIAEGSPMPETTFPVSQGSITVTEFGNSVPYSGKYDDLSEHPVKEIIQKTLKNDAAKTLDAAAHAQFDASLLTAYGSTPSLVAVAENGAFAGAAVEMTLAHVKSIADTMQERNIPVYDGEHYMAIMRPSTLRPVLDELEGIHQYTDAGWVRIMNGEKGRYEGIRFVTQTNIASKGYGTGDAAYFFGADTVTEAISCPLELRGKIPDDYGRGKGIAWYALEQFGITHNDQTSPETKAQARVLRWGGNA